MEEVLKDFEDRFITFSIVILSFYFLVFLESEITWLPDFLENILDKLFHNPLMVIIHLFMALFLPFFAFSGATYLIGSDKKTGEVNQKMLLLELMLAYFSFYLLFQFLSLH